MIELPAAADQPVRDRLATDFGATFFVEAGAGTGKTTTLVGRIVAMIAAGELEPSQLVAITFTEAAAAELRARVREELEKHGSQRTSDAAARLDEAAIDTIHSFAGALIRTYPLESGLPPNFDTLDQIEQDLEFKDRFRAWFEAAAENPSSQRAIKNALLLGLTPDRIEGLAQALHEHYDLLDSGMSWAARPAPSALEAAPGLAERLRAIDGYRAQCLAPDRDKLFARLAEISFCAERLALADSEGKALVAMLELERFPRTIGSRENWEPDVLPRLRGELNGVLEDMVEILKARRAEVLNALLKALRDFVLEYAADRRRRGVATFHDLLTWARDLLRDRPEVRARAQRRWSRIFIDEFQDTDPLQAEIAFYLAARPDREFPGHWLDAELVPGKLFLVGDPKQSIYRFRRADIALYQRIQERIGGDEALTQNFRSVPSVIDFVNRHFSSVMRFQPEIQPRYRPLVAEPRREGSLRWFGRELKKPATQDLVWRSEAAEVARACRLVRDEAWPVSRGKGADRRLEPARWQDICVLIPTRTNLRRLEKEFERWGVPYRLESGELIVMTQEVRELISCLRAIDDPSDQVAIVAALRSGAYGCSDVELALWRDAGGRFDYLSTGADATAELEPVRNVRAALADLKELHHDRHRMAVPALVEHFLDSRLLVAQAFAQQRPRETWRRYRYVAKRARDFAATGRATLRSFVEWMEGLEREQYRDPGISAAEEDDDAVRVLTIHGAKGLEFPVVILTGWGSTGRADRTTVLPDRLNNRLEIGIGDNWQTHGYQVAADREKEAQRAESVRLAYVAATRARDHLMLSLWRKERFRSSSEPPSQAEAFEETLADGDLGLRLDVDAARLPAEPEMLPVAQPSPEAHQAEERAWMVERDRLTRELAGLKITSATALAHEVDPDLEPEDVALLRRGRGGTNFGRAVHGVLQVVPLDTLEGLEELSRGQATIEGIAGQAGAVAEAVRRVAGTDPVRAAVAAGAHWREVPLGAAEGGTLLEGFVDLLFETPAGLRVVDYKTDHASRAEIERRFRRYRLQGGAYALLLGLATGREVAGVDFVFAATGEVRSIEGAALAELVEEVRARLGQGVAAGDEDDGDGAGRQQGEPEGEAMAASKPGDHDAEDGGKGESEGDQLHLTWTAGTEQHR